MLVEHLADLQSHLAHEREGHVLGGVEVDAQLVGMVEVAAAHGPGVPVDDTQVHGPDQVRGVVGHELARVTAAGKGHGGRLQPLRRAVGNALLKERLALDAVDPALHHRGALAQMAHDRLLALQVVLREIHLRELALGEEHLRGVAQAQLAPARLDHRLLALAGRHLLEG